VKRGLKEVWGNVSLLMSACSSVFFTLISSSDLAYLCQIQEKFVKYRSTSKR
jgi:hypothetical protein